MAGLKSDLEIFGSEYRYYFSCAHKRNTLRKN